jgi:putative oxidoreductase
MAMLVLRAIARPMLASIFIVQGWDTMRNPEKQAPRAEPVVRRMAGRVPAVPDDAEQAVRLNGAIQVAAGTLLALGKFPRLSALALAATLVPTTAAGHRFWETDDKQERAQQRVHFLKNVSMLGGLLIAAADTAGEPSLAWRTRNAARSARRDVAVATRTAKVSGKAGQVSGKAAAKASRAREQLPVG